MIYSYGLTEASPQVTYAKTKKLLNNPGTSGISIKDVNIKIVDINGTIMRENCVGEFVVSDPNVMNTIFFIR